MAIKTFRGKLDMGTQKRLRLSTADGLTGYRISKLQIISKTPGVAAGTGIELICQIFATDQSGSISAEVNFSDPDLLGVAYLKDGVAASDSGYEIIIFDKEVFNQDVYINMTDASGNTIQGNYYLELEQIKLNINESTFATLKNLRQFAQ
tara:strand:- start:86 stop:535 length:450 start_codon:yes stop_codon:yes gene_type:complete